jgi:hypothetical protein
VRILFLALLFVSNIIQAQHYIDTLTNYIKHGSNIHVSPGDTLYLQAGNRPYIMLENIHGTQDSIVTIINHNGEVEINTNHYFGLITVNCSHFRITGTGTPGINYGINISKVSNGGGIGLSALSNQFEIDHIRIANTKLAGIYAKTDPDTTFTSIRDSFLMENIKIHHNLIENVNDEGMYIGSTKFFGQLIPYQGGDTLLFPHYIKGVEIYSNIIKHPGWDGIQLSSAIDNASIHDNIIFDDSHRKSHNQMSGIMLGGGTKADCYNNYIMDGRGSGIVLASIGGQKIYNNIIINAGNQYYPGDPMLMQHGIYVGDISTFQDSSFNIINNLIINPKSDGIRFTSLKSKNNLVANNIIINPGNFIFYDTLHTQFTSRDAYIMVSDTSIDIDTSNNYFSLHHRGLNFTDTLSFKYTLKSNSPLIDAGIDISNLNISIDAFNNPRKIGNQFDIGPYEYNSTVVHLSDKTIQLISPIIYPNPARDRITIDFQGVEKARTIKIISTTGQVLLEDSIKRNTGLRKINIETGFLNPGIYFLQIEAENKKVIKRFIKL